MSAGSSLCIPFQIDCRCMPSVTLLLTGSSLCISSVSYIFAGEPDKKLSKLAIFPLDSKPPPACTSFRPTYTLPLSPTLPLSHSHTLTLSLPTFFFPLSSFHFLLSTFFFPLSIFFFPLSIFFFLLPSSHHLSPPLVTSPFFFSTTSPNPEGSGFRVFCSLPDNPSELESPGSTMANPEGSGFCHFCSLPDESGTAEKPERQMRNPVGSGFHVF